MKFSLRNIHSLTQDKQHCSIFFSICVFKTFFNVFPADDFGRYNYLIMLRFNLSMMFFPQCFVRPILKKTRWLSLVFISSFVISFQFFRDKPPQTKETPVSAI